MTPGTAAQPAGVAPVAVPRGLTARRRSRAGIALSLLLIIAGGSGATLLGLSAGDRTQVVTVVRQVPVGQEITARDLSEASVGLDPAVDAVPADQMDQVVGKRAAVELRPGSLLSAGQYTSHSLVREGEQLVPLALKPSQLPATDLTPGQGVLVVSTPGEDGELDPEAAAEEPEIIEARVVKADKPLAAAEEVVVDVAVPAVDGPALAARAATGDIALVVDAGAGS